MTTEQTTQPTPESRVTVGIEQDTQAVTFGAGGQTQSSAAGDSITQAFDKDGVAEELTPEELAALEAEGDDDTPAGEEETPEGDPKPDEEETPEGEEPEALPEWDGDDEAVVSAYEGKYITTDEAGAQVLNFEAFNDEFAKDRGEGKRDLEPSTRKFLKDRFGISDKLIDSHLAGVVAQEREIATAFHLQFGETPEAGKQAYDTMFTWAKESYSPQQRERYNAAMKAGGEAAQEQIELLKTRFLTKNPGKLDADPKSNKGIGLKRERGVSPKKNATAQASAQTPSVKPFANAGEHRVAQNEALSMKPGKEREAALVAVRQRLATSTFWQA